MAERTTTAIPGVHVSERDAFPPALVGVATALPAFIGYTETAVLAGKPVLFQPVRIGSLADYERIFGKGFILLFDIVAGTEEVHDVAAQRWDAAKSRFVTEFHALERTARAGVFHLYDSVRLFYANGGGDCFVVSVGDYTDGGVSPRGVAIDGKKLAQGLDAIAVQAGPSLLVVPDAVLLAPTGTHGGMPVSADYDTVTRKMLAQCGQLQDRFAIIDVYAADRLHQAASMPDRLDAVVANVHTSVGDQWLSYGAVYFPDLVTSLHQPAEIRYTSLDLASNLAALQAILTDQAAYQHPDASAADLSPVRNQNPQFLVIKRLIAQIATTTDASSADGAAAVAQLDAQLGETLPLLRQMKNVIAARANLLPPSGAMAGVYALSDYTRGVWNAPANVTLNEVVQPSLAINNQQQGDLNVPIDGKAIDVIRYFVGRGPVVWGTRTLDGNSNDWRYVQVRRTIVYIEQSIKNALGPFVFEPNEPPTWIAVVAMISNFLQTLWSQGGLMGAKADEAFTVSCGLGSTMTPANIVDGEMIVQVTLQMIRPAEFIALTFRQKMRGPN